MRPARGGIVPRQRPEGSALSRGFLEGLRDRREEVLEDGARAQVDLGRDLHPGREAVALAFRVQILLPEVDERLVRERLAGLLRALPGGPGRRRTSAAAAA